MPAFQITKEKLPDGIIIITVKGFLDAHTYEQFEKTLDELFDANVYRIIVDLSGLDYISSAGAGVFIGAIGVIQENNGNIILMNPTPNVKEVFDLLGLSQIFSFASDRESAIRNFR